MNQTILDAIEAYGETFFDWHNFTNQAIARTTLIAAIQAELDHHTTPAARNDLFHHLRHERSGGYAACHAELSNLAGPAGCG